MMADDAEIDEEIERQLEADAQERNYLEEPLIDEKEFEVRREISLLAFDRLVVLFTFSFSMKTGGRSFH